MAEIATSLAINAAEQLVGKLVGTVYDKMSHELSLLTGLREAVQDIIRELKVMNPYLRDAEEKGVSSEAARALVNEVKLLSYEIEDCLDEVFLHLPDQRGQNTADMANQQKCLHRLVLCCGSFGDRHCIAHQIQRVKSEAEKIHNIKERYGITINESSSLSREEYVGAQLNSQLAALYTEDSQLVGIEERRKELMNLLQENECGLRLIAVVGYGGIGKTTLARKAYDALNFTCRAWITVSQVYHPEGLMREMIKQLVPSTENNVDKLKGVELAGKLREYLNDKRYVIVFDDLWDEKAWDSLRHALPTNDLGSRVIVTTRKEDLANYCCCQIHGYTYYPMKLSPKQSMELFCKRAFNDPEHRTCPKHLEEVTQGILQKCDGLPLAIISIAGLMAHKPNKTIDEWLENILRHLGSKLLGALEGAERVLTLSYNDLPYQVKPCFLYLSKFPEDYEMERKDIQMLWIAEGFVAGCHGMTAEEVAECYFNELTNRFLILPTSFSKVNGKVKTFRLHDIIRELTVSKSQEEKFMTVHWKDSSIPAGDGIRRLSIHSSYNLKGMDLSHVRSLFMFGDGTMTVSPLMRMLRVLDMDCRGPASGFWAIKIPDQLVHLKCLRIRGMEDGSLPESLGKLQNLETLDLSGWRTCIDIPSGVTKLQKLRVLRGVRLNLPRGIGSLRTLQELAYVGNTGDKHVVREIGKLTQLRKLGFRELLGDLAPGSSDGFRESLEALSSSLRSLKLDGPFPSTMYNLSSPPLLLESLGLFSTRGLPNWVGRLNKVVRMRLQCCVLEDGDVRVLGSLPRLTKLHLIENEYPEEIFSTGTSKGILSFGAQEFLRLKVLHLEAEHSYVRMGFERGTMPHLESIILEGYEMGLGIKTVEGFGLTNLPSLKEVRTAGGVHDEVIRDPAQHILDIPA